MAGITVKLKGLRELEGALKQFANDVSARTAKAVLTRAAVKAAKPIAEAMAERAPKRSGKLAASIVVSTNLRQAAARKRRGASGDARAAALLRAAAAEGPAVVVLIGPSVEHSSEASQVEFGAKPHKIRPRKRRGGKVVQIWSGGQVAGFAPEVDHPGVKPHPFLRPGFEAGAPEALRALETGLGVELKKAAERAARRARKG